MSKSRASGRTGPASYAALLLLILIAVFPFYWMAVNALKSDVSVFSYPPELLPTDLSFDALRESIQTTRASTWLRNSVIVGVGTTLASILVGAPAGYALSRFRSRAVRGSGFAMLVTQMMPPLLLLVPMFILFRDLNLLDSLLGLIVANFAWTLPVCVWMMKAAFDTVPVDIEDAALVDGCGRLAVLTRVTLPLARPGVAAATIFTFIQTWDEFIFARTLVSDISLWTGSVGISSFVGEYITPWQTVMAVALVFTLPPVVLFAFIQRSLVAGLTAGGVKG